MTQDTNTLEPPSAFLGEMIRIKYQEMTRDAERFRALQYAHKNYRHVGWAKIDDTSPDYDIDWVNDDLDIVADKLINKNAIKTNEA